MYWEVLVILYLFIVREVMSILVICLRWCEKVGVIVDVLSDMVFNYNGFFVVEYVDDI